MTPLFPGRVGPCDHLRQPTGARDGPLGAGLHDGTGNALRMTLLAVVAQHCGDFPFRRARQPVGGGQSGLWIHAHVQGAVVQKTKPPFGGVQLGRGDTEIQQQSVHTPLQPMPADQLCQARERGLLEPQPGVEPSQFTGRNRGLRVAVDREQRPLRPEAFEYGPAVPSASECAIDVNPPMAHRQHFQRFPQQYRAMT